LCKFETPPNKKADLRRLFYRVKLYYLAAGAVVVVVTAEAASVTVVVVVVAAGAGASTTGAVAGLLQAARVKANRAAIRAERIIINPLGEVAKKWPIINSS
jgi:hypothetical protein